MIAALESLNKLVTTFKKISGEIIPPEHIGAKAPMETEDLPTIVASVKEIKESLIGIGGVVISEKIGEDTFREVKGFKVVAIYQIDIWANSLEKIEEITNAVAEILVQNKNELRKEDLLASLLTVLVK